MPRDYGYAIRATDQSSDVADKIARNTKRAMKSVADDIDKSASAGKQFAQAMGIVADRTEQDLRDTERAVDKLSRALGDDFSADAREAFDALRAGGLTIEEIEADVDDLAAGLKRLDEVSQQAGHGLKDGLQDAEDGTKRLGSQADQSRNALANMVGNSAGELTALGGAGSVVATALGQVAEFAADGGISLASLARVAGPMALLGAGLAVISNIMGDNAERAQRAKELQEGYTDAIREGTDAIREQTAQNFIDSDQIQRAEDLGVNLGVLANAVVDTTNNFGPLTEAVGETFAILGAPDAVVTVDALAEGFRRAGVDGANPLARELMRLAESGSITVDGMADLLDELGILGAGYDAAAEDTARVDAINKALGITLDDTAGSAQAMRDAIDEAASALRAYYGEQSTSLEIGIAFRDSLQALAEVQGQVNEQQLTGQERTDTYTTAVIAGRDQALAMAEALIRQGESTDTVTNMTNLMIDQLFDAAVQAGLTQDEANDLRASLDLMPDQVAINITSNSAAIREQILADFSRIQAATPNIRIPISSEADLRRIAQGGASGGFVGATTAGPSDTIPYMVAPGEFIVNAQAAREVGAGALHAINDGNLPAVAVPGGAVAPAGLNVAIHVGSLTVQTQRIDEQSGQQILDALARAVRRSGRGQIQEIVGINTTAIASALRRYDQGLS